MIIAYLYNKNDEKTAQIFDLNSFTLKQSINSISKASFVLFKWNRYCKKSYLKPFTKIKIKKLESNIEKEIFSWYITEINATFDKIVVSISSEEIILENRINLVKIRSNTTIKIALRTVIYEINQRTWDNFILKCDVDDSVFLDIRSWEDLYWIIKELAWNKYRFALKWKEIHFTNLIWKDRTGDNDYFEYYYSNKEISNRNLKDLNLITDFSWISNSYYLFSGWYYIKKEVEWDVLLEKSDTYSDIDYNILDNKFEIVKNASKSYNIIPLTDDFFEVWLWDLIKVKIDSGNDFLFIDEIMEISEKNISPNWENSFSITSGNIYNKSFYDRIEWIERNIKTNNL